MAVKHTDFELKNTQLILFFRLAGLWLIRHNGRRYVIEHGSYIFSRITWILWHIIGTVGGIWVKNQAHHVSSFGLSVFTDIVMLLVIFLLVGPIQLHILLRNQQWLPKILEDIKKLEDIDLGSKAQKKLRNPTINMSLRNHNFLNTDSAGHAESGISISPTEPDNCCTKLNLLITKLAYILITIAFVVSFCVAAFKESSWADTKDEYKLVVVMFYLVFPVFTTWLCITLIHHHAIMYEVIIKMDTSSFKDPGTIRKVSDYMTQMYRIFDKMNKHIFQLTLGINFGVFVMSGIVCMFEILQGLTDKKKGKDEFSDILYVIPLTIIIFHLYKVCYASDRLYHVHRGLSLKLKQQLPDLLMPQPKPTDFKDVPFKKVELVYKNLKDWPPKVSVYGGYNVNYQILSAMMFFIFAYARVFVKISTVSKAGTAPA